MKDFKEDSIERYTSVQEFINSYITGNESTKDQPYQTWSMMLASVVSLMRAEGLDSEDIINGLEDDLQIIDYFLEMEEAETESETAILKALEGD